MSFRSLLGQRIQELLLKLHGGEWLAFSHLLGPIRSKDELVLTFLALLELVRTGRLNLFQSETFGEIRVQAA